MTAQPSITVPAPFTVHERRRETHDTVTVVLEAPDGFEFTAGQFNMMSPFGVGEAAISISGDAAATDTITHTIRAVGAVTDALCDLRPGDVVGVRGPFGSGWPKAQLRGRDVVVVAGGIGLAPVRPAILDALRDEAGSLSIVYGARTPADLLYTDEYAAWERQGARVEVTVDRADPSWHGDVGFVTTALERVVTGLSRPIAVACGPEVMMRVAAERLIGLGVAPTEILVSLERNMKCGAGWCGHCQYGSDFVCRDGPVFPYSDVETRFSVREL
ncbi:MAG: FAD/NAD(P)-binding protein [Acidimicrobiia bacterium]|nr:FAD/NAD(P)-binding protein [Acidimicrobiia bacterium]